MKICVTMDREKEIGLLKIPGGKQSGPFFVSIFEPDRRTMKNIIETRIKEPIFIRTFRIKFNILDPLKKNLSEAETGGDSSITGFMFSEFLKTFKNSWHSHQNSSLV